MSYSRKANKLKEVSLKSKKMLYKSPTIESKPKKVRQKAYDHGQPTKSNKTRLQVEKFINKQIYK